MKPSEVQGFFAAQLAASDALVAFVPALVFSHLAPIAEQKTQIEQRLRALGVCLEVGSVECPEVVGTQGGDSILQARCEVYVGENPKVAHTPYELELVEAVIAAITLPVLPSRRTPKCRSIEGAESEQGYILHVIDFEIPVKI